MVLKEFVLFNRGYQQQDAHEFMHYLLDRVHTELLLSQKACFGKETIVTGIFGGILQSEVSHTNVVHFQFYIIVSTS